MAVLERPKTTCEQTADERVIAWNEAYPEGTRVLVNVLDTQARTETRGAAFVLNGRPVVMVHGVKGALPMADVQVSPLRAWVKIKRKGRDARWIEGWWDDREHLEQDLQKQRDQDTDSRIESIEVRNVRPSDA